MRRYAPPIDPFAVPEINTPLPTDRDIALYYRQSTMEQVGNNSTAMQTIDLPEYVIRLGWERERIILIDMDEGVSGTKKIDERPGMRMLFEWIVGGKISAVVCQDEDRLFRDMTQIQVNLFIEACRSHGVRVLTPSVTYDFAHPSMGKSHIRQFRMKLEMAADYIETHIKHRLAGARRRMATEGKWAGNNVPRGLMVDMRKTLSDGTRNPHWRHYVPFDLFADIVNEYFRLFVTDYGGNLMGTIRHIARSGPHYPTSYEVPQGFHAQYVTKSGEVECRPYPSVPGLTKMLTNVAYIGHWPYAGTVMQWNTHPAIVPVELFMQAYNYLSPTDFNGNPNPGFITGRVHARPSLEAERNVERPLCVGLLVFDRGDGWHPAGTEWNKATENYAYIARSAERPNRGLWTRRASDIDEAVASLALRRLRATFDESIWTNTLEKHKEGTGKEREQIRTQLKALEQVKANLIASLEVVTNDVMRLSVQQRFEAAEAEQKRLESIVEAGHEDDRRLEAINALRESYGPAIEKWSAMRPTEQRAALQFLIRRIEAESLGIGVLHLVIYWRDESTSTIEVATHGRRRGKYWSPDDHLRLRELINRSASTLEIAETFPDRTWNALSSQLQRMGITNYKKRPYDGSLTYLAYKSGEEAIKNGDSQTYSRAG